MESECETIARLHVIIQTVSFFPGVVKIGNYEQPTKINEIQIKWKLQLTHIETRVQFQIQSV